MNEPFHYAIVGCGRVGFKRMKSIPTGSLKVACDIDLARAEALARESGTAIPMTGYREAISHPDVDIVIISTLNSDLARVSAAAIAAGKHVLVEKPVGINSDEIENLMRLAQKQEVHVRPGFNHRFHPSFQRASAMVRAGAIGDLMFVRGRYGHGGRLGYESEWRADPRLSGGGELMDQGVHLIDLAKWFLGNFETVEGHVRTYFWNMPVDDNAFLSLQTKDGLTAWLHVSSTEWKNLFSFEIYGQTGKLHIEGLGASYGVERLYYYKMLPPMGPPETTIWEFPGADDSWRQEIQAFEEDIRHGREPSPSLKDALDTLRTVEALYKKTPLLDPSAPAL